MSVGYVVMPPFNLSIVFFFPDQPSWKFIHFVVLLKELGFPACVIAPFYLYGRIITELYKFWREALVLISGSSVSLLWRTSP